MLARDEQKPDDASAALVKALQTIKEAEQTSDNYQQRFASLLSVRKSAKDTQAAMANENDLNSGEVSARQLLEQAEDSLGASIKAMEAGQLNQTQEQATNAEKLYRQALDIMLPALSDKVSRLISRAPYAAKRHAPKTLAAAKNKAAELRAYVDGLSETAPSRPADALYLAQELLSLSRQIKAWDKKPESFENLFLEGRALRVELAHELKMPLDEANPVADVPAAKLIKATRQLQTELAQEKKAHLDDIKRLRQEHEAELEARLSAQSSEFLQAKNEQLSSMKEAFRAKLERETFEKNRQAKVIKLFKPEEASILANLDGSLIVRLSALQFAPNKSKIDKKYHDLLSRLKQTLDVYADRSVRVEGHTDNQGDVKSNQLLSLKRAESVRDFLIAAGVNGARLKALGYGEVRPIASNDFAKGRAMNRRIDIVIDAAKQPPK